MRWFLSYICWCLIVIAAGAGPSISGALACGNYSHVWAATDALNFLAEGDLQDLLNREGLVEIIRNGAMYPDGGYAVGDGYGETSHWEPFHLTYLEWIRDNYQPPWSDEAAQHIAFLMGMAAHGMGDQLYDGMYLERHKHYDEHGSEATVFGVDGATDVCFAITQGQMPLPEKWVPAEVLAPLYEKLNGHQVSPETILNGHEFVIVAIMHANDAQTNPNTVAEYMELYPWACGNQDNPGAPGSPLTLGRPIAAYWGVLWAILHDGGDGFDKPLLATHFTGGTPYDQPMDASTPDSWVHFVVPRGLDPATINTDTVVVTGAGGEVHPVKLHVYYGFNSHLVNIKPLEDWAEDTEYTVTVSPPIAAWDGASLLQSDSFTFATLPEPVVEIVETNELGDVGVAETADIVSDEVDAGIAAPDEAAHGAVRGGCSSAHSQGCPPEACALLVLILCCLAGLRQRFQQIRVAVLYEFKQVRRIVLCRNSRN